MGTVQSAFFMEFEGCLDGDGVRISRRPWRGSNSRLRLRMPMLCLKFLGVAAQSLPRGVFLNEK